MIALCSSGPLKNIFDIKPYFFLIFSTASDLSFDSEINEADKSKLFESFLDPVWLVT